MSKLLKIKDPIFGYIEIDDDDFIAVINSAMFQRLRDIVQTSYPSVYPSAVHNRFTHSLGVFHLGKIAQRSLSVDIKAQKLAAEEDVDKIGKTFLLACLMHDIGHSPFSHTGEKFYFKEIGESDQPRIWQKLLEELNDKEFVADLKDKTKPVGAEHEIMSAYVSMVNYPDIFKVYDKSFFTRCIIGLKYSKENDIRNCYIDLLNSKTIDVDKLDYLIRDSFTTGFKSINIDYERLLNSVCVINDNEKFLLGFTRSALSTLESVILAHDMERKWIQSHPVIMYEGCLVAYMIAVVQNDFERDDVRLFSSETLSETGVDKGKTRICLLSDSDISANAKRYYGNNPRITEYFARGKRKKPLWKSESEYRYYFDPTGVSKEVLTLLEERIDFLEKALVQQFEFPIINQDVLNYFNCEIDAVEDLPKEIAGTKKDELNKIVGLINLLKEFATENGFLFEYVVTRANQFKTGFNKDELKDIRVRIRDGECCKLQEILKLFSAETPREKFFYLFVTPESKHKINTSDLSRRMVNYALKQFQHR